MIHKRIDIKPLQKDKLFNSILDKIKEDAEASEKIKQKKKSKKTKGQGKKKQDLAEAIELSRIWDEPNELNTKRNIGNLIPGEDDKELNFDEGEGAEKFETYNVQAMQTSVLDHGNKRQFIEFNYLSEEEVKTVERDRLYRQYARVPDVPGSHVDSCRCEHCMKLAKEASRIRTFKVIGTSKLLQNVLEFNGLKKAVANECNLIWSNQDLKSSTFKSMKKFQKINLFPRSFECTRKDALATNLNIMSETHGRRNFGFVPECYVWPREREAVCKAIAKSKGRPWILKPAGSSQGRGVSIITKISQLPCEGSGIDQDDNWIVEKYIDNPLLFDGKKFDLRLYVCVTSFHPLKIYIHEEGLVRLATEPYSNESYENNFVHLTNYSINKKNLNYLRAMRFAGNDEAEENLDEATARIASNDNDDNSEVEIGVPRPLKKDYFPKSFIEQASIASNPKELPRSNKLEVKWPLSEFNSRLREMGANADKVWHSIHDAIIKTIISVESKVMTAMDMFVPYPDNCFELFGFDILLDSNFSPWLMEVNFSPSMNTDTSLDHKIKTAVIVDLLNLVGIHNQLPSGPAPKVDSDPMTLAIKKLREVQNKAAGENTARCSSANRTKRQSSNSMLTTKLQQMGDAYNLDVVRLGGRIPIKPALSQQQVKKTAMSSSGSEDRPKSALKASSSGIANSSDIRGKDIIRGNEGGKQVTMENGNAIVEPEVEDQNIPLKRNTSFESRMSSGKGSNDRGRSKSVQAFVVDAASRKKSMMHFESKDHLRPRYDYAKTNNFREVYKQHIEQQLITKVAMRAVQTVIDTAVANIIDEIKTDFLNNEPSIYWQNETFIECKQLNYRFPVSSRGQADSGLPINEKAMLIRTVEELIRSERGRFNLIFPSAASHQYLPYFQQERPYNVILSKYLFSLSNASQTLQPSPRESLQTGMTDSLKSTAIEFAATGGSSSMTASKRLPLLISKADAATSRPVSPSNNATGALPNTNTNSNYLRPAAPSLEESYPFIYLNSAPAEPLAYSFDLNYSWKETLRVPYASTVLAYVGKEIPSGQKKRPVSAAPTMLPGISHNPHMSTTFDGTKQRAFSAGATRSIRQNSIYSNTEVSDVGFDGTISSVNDRFSDSLVQMNQMASTVASSDTKHKQDQQQPQDASAELDFSLLHSPTINVKWAKAVGQSLSR